MAIDSSNRPSIVNREQGVCFAAYCKTGSLTDTYFVGLLLGLKSAAASRPKRKNQEGKLICQELEKERHGTRQRNGSSKQ